MKSTKIRNSWRGALVLVSLPVLFATFVFAESPPVDDSWERNNLQWFEKIPPGGLLQVVNPYGNIYARFGGYENQVEVLATIQRLEPELPALEVGFHHVEGGLDVIVAPRAGEGSAPPPGPGETRDRVDLVVFVPQYATFHARTESDRIEAKGLEGDFVAESVKGDIWLRKIKGSVRAKTERGQISAMLETGVTEAAQQLSTKTGEIEVHLWEDAKTKVSIATSGEISTDFSLEIEHRRFEEPGKHAVAVIGGGGPELSLYSKRGRIRLLRLPRHFRPDADAEATK